MLYSVDSYRIFHDLIRNSSNSCAYTCMHGRFITMLRNLYCLFEKCRACFIIEFCELRVYFAHHIDFMGTYFWMEVINTKYLDC